MKRTVYVETTIIGYLAMRPSNMIRIAANQIATQEWWNEHRGRFDLFVSPFVEAECLRGDPIAANERVDYLNGIPILPTTPEVESLATAIVNSLQIPEKAVFDAYHISIAAFHGIEYLLTWNCKHIANIEFRPKIEKCCRGMGFEPPVICTPVEILEVVDE